MQGRKKGAKIVSSGRKRSLTAFVEEGKQASEITRIAKNRVFRGSALNSQILYKFT
jgi:hypothetical protein